MKQDAKTPTKMNRAMRRYLASGQSHKPKKLSSISKKNSAAPKFKRV